MIVSCISEQLSRTTQLVNTIQHNQTHQIKQLNKQIIIIYQFFNSRIGMDHIWRYIHFNTVFLCHITYKYIKVAVLKCIWRQMISRMFQVLTSKCFNMDVRYNISLKIFIFFNLCDKFDQNVLISKILCRFRSKLLNKQTK